MKWPKLSRLWKKQSTLLNGNLPASTLKLDEFYSENDASNRWQGDLYAASSFTPGALPSDQVPYWMLANRTCHLYTSQNRSVKLSHLNFIAVRPVSEFITNFESTKKIINELKEIIGKNEKLAFLPESNQLLTPHVVVLNYVATVPLAKCPQAVEKVLQLSSPFSEHLFQKFARFFYTVGFDDDRVKSDVYLGELSDKLLTEASKTKTLI